VQLYRSNIIDSGWAVVTQEYENNSDDPIEAVFTFPKDDQAAITGLKVTTNNKTLIGQIEASDEAQEKYSDAIAEGKGAYLLSQKRSDIVTLYIGKFVHELFFRSYRDSHS
jgi:poly [ADP-ribose] polymerase